MQHGTLPKFVVGLLACSVLPVSAATIYKCSWQGVAEYRDTPCTRGTQELISIKDEKVNKQLPGESLLKAGFKPQLRGNWCEYAIATTPDGQKDESRKVSWAFGEDGFLDYRMQGDTEHIRTPFEIVDQEIQTRSGLIGAWGIASYDGNKMILTGPLGGYAFLQRGDCPAPEPVEGTATVAAN